MEIGFNLAAKSLRETGPDGRMIFGGLEKDIIYTFSGKSSLCLLLQYYRRTGRLHDRAEQLLVPQWLGDPVYMVMHEYCFPTTFFNEKVKGVMVYHQWGFPQDMSYIRDFCRDKKLFLIEDCAHSFESYYRGERLGTLGDASFFSLSKFFPSVVGGAIFSKNSAIKNFVNDTLPLDDAKLAKDVFVRRFKYDKSPTPENTIELRRDYAVYGQLSRCPGYSLAAAGAAVSGGAILKRRRNYDLYKQAFGGEKYLAELFKEDVLPWVVPLFFDEARLKKIVAGLRKNGVKSDIYHFDVNRNMLRPDFMLCVPLPCHQGLDEKDIYKIVDIVKEAVK